MRDPARIKRITDKLALVWQANPDWRLGQLLENINPWQDRRVTTWHVEDDAWEKRLDDLLLSRTTR